MIIEAGYDLYQLLAPKLLRGKKPRDATWVVVMDEDLRFMLIAKVRTSVHDSVESQATQIYKALTRETWVRAKYFAIGRLDTSFVCSERSGDDYPGGHLDVYDEAIRKAPALQDFELIGHMHSDGVGLCSDVPRFSLRDYGGLEHLPRSESFPGPHSFAGDCCPACIRFNDRLDANRARAESIEALDRQLDG